MSADTTIAFEPPGPVAKAFMESRKEVRVILGPVGSAKSSTAVITLLAHAATQPKGPDGFRRSRFGVVRNSYRDLKGATIKTYQDWMPKAFGRLTLGSPIVHTIEAGDIRSEVYFFPLDTAEDAERIRSFEFTAIWFDEASEIPWEIVQAALARVGRYPSQKNGGSTWSGLLLTSNMTDPDHWLYKKFENVPSTWSFHVQPGGLTGLAENVKNLKPGYYESVAASNDIDWVRRFVNAEFLPAQTGNVVYPSFRDSFHVAEKKLEPSPELGVVLGLDFGLTPACVFLQQQADGRVVIFDELVGDDVGLQRFANTLSVYCSQHYPQMRVIGAFGDPAGTARSTDTERTAFDIFNVHTPWRWRPARTNEISTRIEAVSWFLGRSFDGLPGLQLSPACSVLRAGFNGKYAYAPIRSANETSYHETPNKGPHSHIHDALQYAVLGLGGAELVLGKAVRDAARQPRMARDLEYDLTGDRDNSRGSRRDAEIRHRAATFPFP